MQSAVATRWSAAGITALLEDILPPPVAFLEGASLFLDLDGTLVDLVDQPDEVIADEPLRGLLRRLMLRLNGRLAVVSGRSLAQLDRILGPVAGQLALAGSHGAELRWQGATVHPDRPVTLDHAAESFRHFAGNHPGLIVEEKSFGVALHYRMAPALEAEARGLAQRLAEALGLAMQPGNMMVELRTPGSDKGSALRELMPRPPMAGTKPVFIGDDLTDEPGFAAAMALGGDAILVGAPRPSAARYRISGPAALRQWLEGAVR